MPDNQPIKTSFTDEELFGSTDTNPSAEVKTSFTDDDLWGKPKPVKTVNKDTPDFIPGVMRGIDTMQATGYGAAALAGSGLKKVGFEDAGQAVQDWGMEGYRRNIEEAEENPKKYSFKDVYTGKAGVGGAIDWAQGTLGELIPSMAEAAGGALIGSLAAPGAGTAAGGLAGRTILKRSINKLVKEGLEKGIGDLTEDQLRKQITKQALKKLGGKVGIGAAVMPLESGGNYAELLESHGIDAPETALLFGGLSTSLEFFGGNSKLVDVFVDSLAKGAKGTVKKTAKEILSNIPEEALQEGGQEVFNILNTVANTDEKFLTPEHVEQIVESMGAGAVGGSAGSFVNLVTSGNESKPVTGQKTGDIEETNTELDNIFSYGEEFVDKAKTEAQNNITEAQAVLNDYKEVDKLAREQNVSPEEIVTRLVDAVEEQKRLVTNIDARRKKQQAQDKKAYEKLSPRDKALKDANEKIMAQRMGDADKTNQEINELDKEIAAASEEYYGEDFIKKPNPEKQKEIAERIINLRRQKRLLVDQQEANKQPSYAPYTTREDRQKVYEDLFGPLDVSNEKNAEESAKVFEDSLVPKQIADYAKSLIDIKSAERNQLDNQERQITPEEENNLQHIADYVNYVKTYINNQFTNQEKSLIENYWQGVKKELNLRNEEMTPGTEAFLRKKFFETKLAEIEGNIQKDTETKAVSGQKVTVPLAEQNKRQQWFQQVAKELGDFNVPNMQEVQTETPRYLPGGKSSPFNNEQRDAGTTPQFEVREGNFVKDSSGNEVVGFHGTQSEPFESFDDSRIQQYEHGWSGAGHYFTLNKNYAQNYADLGDGSGRLVQARFTFKNPLYKNSPEYNKILKDTLGKTSILNKEDGFKATEAFKEAGYDAVIDGRSLEDSFEINVFDSKNIHYAPGQAQFQTSNQSTTSNISLADVEKMFPGQEVTRDETGKISVRLKNGKGITFQNIRQTDNGFVQMAIETGQMSKNGRILGITIDTDILLDENFADNRTLWHENKHVLDNLGLITEEENAALNREFNKLRKKDKLEFALSTHKDPVQAMIENRANMFAQIMANREEYRNTTFGKVIQRVMDFFNQLLAFSKQTVSGLAREVESGRLYEREVNNENQEAPLFQVAEATPEQTIPQAQYDRVREQKNNLLQDIMQTARMRVHDIKLLADKSMGSISTRLKNINPMIMYKMRQLDFEISQKIVSALKTAKPIMDTAKKDMSKEDRADWDWARKNSDEGKIKQLAQKYGILQHVENLREVLNTIRQEAIDVGYDVGFIDEYWPRIIKDQEGFLQATQEISERPVFTEAIKAQAEKLGLTVKQFERDYPEVKADIISNLILGRGLGIGGPGNIQSRVFETIPEEYAKYYMDSDAALMQYIYSMTKKIEARKFFGKVPERIQKLKLQKKQRQVSLDKLRDMASIAEANNSQELPEYLERIESLKESIMQIDEKLDAYKFQRDYTENIGAYIDDLRMNGQLHKKDEKTLRDILDARFHEHGTTGIINAYKNLAYIDTMGSPISAFTQIGDLAWAMYVGKVWTPKGFSDTVKNVIKAVLGKSDITKEDLGIERIAQEFADGTTLSRAVSKVFKTVGLEKIDSIGKETLINNALSQYKAQASTEAGREKLLKELRPIFGNKSNQVIEDLLASNPTDNVKMLLYFRLLDFQPVALSEMPEYYLKGGNGRVFYMLKTYTLKQMDVFRNEAWHNIKSGEADKIVQGIANMSQLLMLLTLANAGADELKDFALGKETKFEDHVIENFLTMGGASRYMQMQVSKEGFGSAFAQKILPPFKFINSASKDLATEYEKYVTGDTINFNHARIIDSIPVGGKLYYWHFGRGVEYKKSVNEQEFKKVGKDVRRFEKKLENADDKRIFIRANIDDFKQMKLHQKFQGALNRNQAVINKLEKLEQTTNVRTRIGQLKAQREQILDSFFEFQERIME